MAAERLDWVDGAKGICILLVVMFHATGHLTPVLGAGAFAEITHFSGPFRMPDFFLISGLFLARRLHAPDRVFYDRKVLHFFYFYWLWVAITFVALQADMAALARALIYPTGHLWFIYCLPLCFVLARLMRGLPPALVWLAAAAAHVFDVDGEPLLIVYLSHYFVFFYTGHVASSLFFRLAGETKDRPVLAVAGLLVWAGLNAFFTHGPGTGFPGLSLVLGVAGGLAITVIASLAMSGAIGRSLAWLGERSIVVYLGFFLPMKAVETVLVAQSFPVDLAIGLAISAGVGVPLLLHALLARARFGRWLFARPDWARLRSAKLPTNIRAPG
ncbi:MAG: acyltransferase family protein [Pseudomonadota bacterium]